MNNILKAGQPTELKDLISYEDGSICKPRPRPRRQHEIRADGL